MTEGDFSSKTLQRVTAEYKDLSEVFRVNTRDFKHQYAAVYRQRYEKFYPLLKNKAINKWGTSDYKICDVCDLPNGVKTIVIGTLFKVMARQPSILKEISEDIPEDGVCNEASDNYTDDSDSLVLEDLRQRVSLRTSEILNVHEVVTGVPVALLGEVDVEDAHFIVHDLCFIGITCQPERILPSDEKYAVFISGMDLSSSNDLTPFQLFVDYVTGILGSTKDQQRASKICRIIIGGNMVAARSSTQDGSQKFSFRKEVPDNAPSVVMFDAYLAQIAKSVPVDIMPGKFDPANFLMPQQPLHHCLFPKSAKYQTLLATTNPHQFELDGIRFLGCSGQNLEDVLRFSRISSPIEAMTNLVEWSHFAPTTPDTLPTYPHFEEDPFVIKETPHVVFVANQKRFEQKLYKDPQSEKEVLLLSIPSFIQQPSCVWLNLSTLKATKMDFLVDTQSESD